MTESHLWNNKDQSLPDIPSMYEAEEYDSWSEFAFEYGDSDMGRNFLVSYDWLSADGPDQELDSDEFRAVFYFGSKGTLRFTETKVSKDDENSVLEFISKRANFIRQAWKSLDNDT